MRSRQALRGAGVPLRRRSARAPRRRPARRPSVLRLVPRQAVGGCQTSDGRAQAQARRGLMARALWTGSLSFGLVTCRWLCTARCVTATSTSTCCTGPTIRRSRRAGCARTSRRRCPGSEIVKGYELDDGRWVLLSDSDLEAAAPRKSHTIDIEAFVEEREIDPLYLDRPYLLVAENESGRARLCASERSDGGLRQGGLGPLRDAGQGATWSAFVRGETCWR